MDATPASINLAPTSNASHFRRSLIALDAQELPDLTIRPVKKHTNIRIGSKIDLTIYPSKLSLFTISNKHGWFFAGHEQKILASPLSELRTSLGQTSTQEETTFLCQVTLDFGTNVPIFVCLAAGESRLVVASSMMVAIWDVQAVINGETTPIQSLKLGNFVIADVQPNPGDSPNIVAFLASGHSPEEPNSVVLFDCVTLNEVVRWIGTTQGHNAPLAMSWSTKGKQIAIGTSGGDILQYSPTDPTVAKATVPRANGPGTAGAVILLLQWISNTTFHVVYAQPRDPDELDDYLPEQFNYIILFDKKSGFITDMHLPTPWDPYGLAREPGHRVLTLRNWGRFRHLLFISSSNAIDVGIVGCIGEPSGPEEGGTWVKVSLNEDPLTFPLGADMEDTSVVGMDVDFTATTPLLSSSQAPGDDPQLPPAPIIYLFTGDTVVAAFHVLNESGQSYPAMASDQAMEVLSGPAPPTKTVGASAQPGFTGGGFGFGAQPTTSFGQTGFGNASGAKFGSTPFGGSAFGSSGFGAASTPAFGSTGFGSAPKFGSTGFGSAPSTSAFGSTGFGSGSSSNSAFGSTGFGSFANAPANKGFASFAASTTGPTFGQGTSTSESPFGALASTANSSVPAFAQAQPTDSEMSAFKPAVGLGGSTSAFNNPSAFSTPTKFAENKDTPMETTPIASTPKATLGFGASPSPFTQAQPKFGQTSFGGSTQSPMATTPAVTPQPVTSPFAAATSAVSPTQPKFGQTSSLGAAPQSTGVSGSTSTSSPFAQSQPKFGQTSFGTAAQGSNTTGASPFASTPSPFAQNQPKFGQTGFGAAKPATGFSSMSSGGGFGAFAKATNPLSEFSANTSKPAFDETDKAESIPKAPSTSLVFGSKPQGNAGTKPPPPLASFRQARGQEEDMEEDTNNAEKFPEEAADALEPEKVFTGPGLFGSVSQPNVVPTLAGLDIKGTAKEAPSTTPTTAVPSTKAPVGTVSAFGMTFDKQAMAASTNAAFSIKPSPAQPSTSATTTTPTKPSSVFGLGSAFSSTPRSSSKPPSTPMTGGTEDSKDSTEGNNSGLSALDEESKDVGSIQFDSSIDDALEQFLQNVDEEADDDEEYVQGSEEEEEDDDEDPELDEDDEVDDTSLENLPAKRIITKKPRGPLSAVPEEDEADRSQETLSPSKFGPFGPKPSASSSTPTKPMAPASTTTTPKHVPTPINVPSPGTCATPKTKALGEPVKSPPPKPKPRPASPKGAFGSWKPPTDSSTASPSRLARPVTPPLLFGKGSTSSPAVVPPSLPTPVDKRPVLPTNETKTATPPPTLPANTEQPKSVAPVTPPKVGSPPLKHPELQVQLEKILAHDLAVFFGLSRYMASAERYFFPPGGLKPNGLTRDDLKNRTRWTRADIGTFTDIIKDEQKRLVIGDELLREIERKMADTQSMLLKADMKREETVRYVAARRDPSFVDKFIKPRQLGPEHAENQSRLRKNIQAQRERLRETEDHIQRLKKRIENSQNGQYTNPSASLDMINRTCRNIDFVLGEKAEILMALEKRVDALPRAGGSSQGRGTISLHRKVTTPRIPSVPEPKSLATTVEVLAAEVRMTKLRDILAQARAVAPSNSTGGRLPNAGLRGDGLSQKRKIVLHEMPPIGVTSGSKNALTQAPIESRPQPIAAPLPSQTSPSSLPGSTNPGVVPDTPPKEAPGDNRRGRGVPASSRTHSKAVPFKRDGPAHTSDFSFGPLPPSNPTRIPANFVPLVAKSPQK